MLHSQMLGDSRRDTTVLVVAALTLVTVFLIDIATPLGMAIWVFYLLPLSLCLLQTRPAVALLGAALISVLEVAGLLLSPPGTSAGGSFEIAAVNRLLGMMAVWGLAWLALTMIRARAELRETAWVREGESRVHQRLLADNEPVRLAREITTELCHYLGAAGGAMYTVEGRSLRLLGGYALGQQVQARQTIPVGEGIAGEVAEHCRLVTLIGLPDAYFELSSATGSANARALIAFPLTAHKQVCGVMEIAFVGDRRWVSEAALRRCGTLLEEVADAVGMSLRSAEMRGNLFELLEETQRQSEALQSQQAALHSANEELEEHGRNLRANQTRLERQQAELEQANARLEAQKVELLETQRDLRNQATELERASRFKSEFLANLSHELRTPLNSALILARLLADNADGRLGAEQVRYAQTIYDANADLLVLINDILDLSKIEAGKLELRLEPTLLEPLLQAEVSMFDPVAQQRGLRFLVDIEACRGRQLRTDPIHLQQILRNLLSNAFKFTERGEVEFRAEPVGDDHLRFIVRDTGIGIDPESHALVFEAFRQADSSTRRRFGGTGLGLSISLSLTERLGGQLWFESQAGSGSTFFLELPVDGPPREPAHPASTPVLTSPQATSEPSPPAQSAVTESPVPEPPLRSPAAAPPPPISIAAPAWQPGPELGDATVMALPRKRVLLLGDDVQLRTTRRGLLRAPGVEIMEADTVVEALRIIDQHAPDCVVVDLGQPGTIGEVLLEMLSGRGQGSTPPVIIYTAQMPTGEHETRLLAQAECIIVKGALAAARLVGEVMAVLDRGRGAPAAEQTGDNAAPTRDAEFDGRCILLAEDDVRTVFALMAAFEPRGAKVAVARNGREAVERTAAGGIDLALMDIVMPEMDGLEAIRRIRAVHGGHELPIIALTAKAMEEDRQACLDAGANDYMAKPIDMARLLAVCRKWMPVVSGGGS